MSFKFSDEMEKAFLKYIYRRHCKFDEHSEVVNEIEKTVQSIVDKVLARVAKKTPVLEISKTVSGGSFYEQTKVGAPDKFDYMVIVQLLSLPGTVKLEEGCTPWYKKIHITSDADKYKDYLESEDKLSNELLTRKFWGSLLVQCQNEVISETFKYGTIRTKGCKSRKLLLEYIKHERVETLEVNYDENQVSDSKELVHLPYMEIGVDLMIAIDYPNIADVFSQEGFPSEWSDLVREKGCQLVAKSCQSLNPCSTCWHVSLATSESSLMREMDAKHKKCYQVLKYLMIREVSFPGKCANLSSYMLKNAFMFHVYGKTNCSKDEHSCIYAVLDYIAYNFRQGKMPCFLSRNIDTWGPVLKFPALATRSGRYPNTFLDEGTLGIEWYAVCWLELWCRVVLKVQSLLREVKTHDDQAIQEQFYMMKESMMLLIECYCKHTNFIQMPTDSKDCKMPTSISETEMNTHFIRYFKRLQELFDVKLGNLVSEEIYTITSSN